MNLRRDRGERKRERNGERESERETERRSFRILAKLKSFHTYTNKTLEYID